VIPATLAGFEATKADFYARSALCVDRRKLRTHVARRLADTASLIQ